MGMVYYKLFDVLRRKGMGKSDLSEYKVISPATVAKLSKGEGITVESVEKICAFLHCQPGDIMEYVPDDWQVKIAQVSYQKLFDQFKAYGISEADLDKLLRRQAVSTDTIIALCRLLKCQPGDIMEYVPGK